jgi:hypothetical protein
MLTLSCLFTRKQEGRKKERKKEKKMLRGKRSFCYDLVYLNAFSGREVVLFLQSWDEKQCALELSS